MTQCEKLHTKHLLECYQLLFNMGVIQSQLQKKKSRRNEKKQAKRQQEATSDKEKSDTNEPSSPPNKRKIAKLLKNLSPKTRNRNRNRNEISQDTSTLNNVKEISPGNCESEKECNNLSNKIYLLSDSQADSAINLDNQSDSAIQLMDNSETFREYYSEAVNSEDANVDNANDVPCDCVQVIVNESSNQLPQNANQEDTSNYLVHDLKTRS